MDLTLPGIRLQEDMAPTDEGRHDGRGCYPGYCPRLGGVEKEDKPDPLGDREKVVDVRKLSILTHKTNFITTHKLAGPQQSYTRSTVECINQVLIKKTYFVLGTYLLA